MKGSSLVIATTLALTMTSCASQIQAVDGYMSAGAVSARAAEDVNLKRLEFELCATPFSAVVRNPRFAGSLKDLCLGVNGTTVESLIGEVKINE